MTSRVHEFDPREGGSFRIRFIHDGPIGAGKTTARTDTYRSRFVKPVLNEQILDVVEFETADPALLGEMTIRFARRGGRRHRSPRGTRGLPSNVPDADNEAGRRSTLAILPRSSRRD